eukprot:269578_1
MSALLLTLINICLIIIISNALLTSNSGAILTIMSGSLSNTNYEVSQAQFGYLSYKSSITALLILPANISYHSECTDQGPEPLGINPYVHFIKDWFVSPNDITDYILMIDRSDCLFADKIYHAQTIGASAAIICDSKNEALFDMLLPKNYVNNITIPSVLLQRFNCESIMNQLGVQNYNPVNTSNMIYPSTANMQWTAVKIQWGLPRTNNKIILDFWTSATDVIGAEFMHNFTTIAIGLEQANSTIFTPHLHILNGTHWGCDIGTFPCKQQCSNSGRYCAVDPEYDLTIGLDGMDVVQENLRSLCVREYVIDSKSEYMLWWNYTLLWNQNCGISTTSTQHFTANCSFLQMDILDNTGTLKTFVTNCIVSSGGYGYTNGINTLLEAEIKLGSDSSIDMIPMMKLNKFWFSSTSIECATPVTTETCAILEAICQSFINGTKPSVCSLSGTCDKIERDCLGICFGNHLINPCGRCISSSRSDFHTYGMDCSGGCDDQKQFDACGVCLLLSDINWNNCIGCDNIPHSNKEFNVCGRCIAATDPNFNNYGKDCRGICVSVPEETYYVDQCGQCLLLADAEWNSCLHSSTTTEPTIVTSVTETSETTDIRSSDATVSIIRTSNGEMSTDTTHTLLSTDISVNKCPLGCLLYFDGCNMCWCSADGEFTSCSRNECNDTNIDQAYCKECNNEEQYCDDGSVVNRLLEEYCEFEQCSDDSIDIHSNDAKCDLRSLFTIVYCVSMVLMNQ